MSIRVALSHFTKYNYDRPTTVFPQVLRLKPAPHTRTPIVSYSLEVSPANHFINWQQDPFGNYNARIVFNDLVKELAIKVDLVVDLVTFNPFDFFMEDYAKQAPFDYTEQGKKELTPYLEVVEAGPHLMALKQKVEQHIGDNTVDFLVNVNRIVFESINYIIRLEHGIQTCEESLDKALGSCRDSAWVLVQLMRHFGLAARFVSGYLVQLKPDEIIVGGANGPEEDFTDLHAWAEIYVPGAGWIGLDATSGLLAGEGHIPLACTPDPASAAPITGMTGPTQSTMEYSNTVTRIKTIPRVTLPYEANQVAAMVALGHTVDKMLEAGNAQLTMGGEPTFVSSVDMQSDQWNEAADGEDKRKQAYKLSQLLSDAFAHKGLIHLGQGKWYPGEPIPRWQYSTYWRKDGQAIWNNPKWFADPNTEGKASLAQATTFAEKLSNLLGVDIKGVQEAYEDTFYYLWEKGNLPSNVDVKDINLKESLVRQTLAKVIGDDASKPVGLVLPVKWNYDDEVWQTSVWPMTREQLYLIPGNSDMGYRLPLDRLPKEKPSLKNVVLTPDPLKTDKTLVSIEQLNEVIKKHSSFKDSKQTSVSKSIIKTSLCFSIKNGNLAIFIPPIDTIEPFLQLMRALEMVCEELQLPIMIEGYQPPFDPRVEKLVVAPDPGVIEVNIHPSSSWQQIVEKYTILFDKASHCELGAQKFMLDGKHSGTGGGNHITLGGSTPAMSPILRRPDVLRSMLTFWNNHPALSYLFSSPFVGMTSQAPRLDEGKPDAIYNLEIAFKELDKYDDPPFWLVDRAFRNILTDITGNTHRAEFCIDKLYSPDSSTGRLGILELRGFDMPPHRDMCMVQLLLVRCLFTAFWNKPYKQKLAKWGNELHDRFMIKHYVKRDMEEVVAYLNDQGIAFDKEWLEPFYEFKFPILGQLLIDETQLTLRSGIEPWNVLGEEMSSTGTARFVDSSMERVEVALSNFNAARYKLLCNKTVVPLNPTSTPLSFVVGIRYKAWAPPSAMHPTKGIDTPLVFDIYDTWSKRSIGGCTYHVMHPGGRSYDTFPVNAFEAEGRRVARFYEENHTPQNETTTVTQSVGLDQPYRYIAPVDTAKELVDIVVPAPNEEYPFTLDLQSV